MLEKIQVFLRYLYQVNNVLNAYITEREQYGKINEYLYYHFRSKFQVLPTFSISLSTSIKSGFPVWLFCYVSPGPLHIHCIE